MRKGKQQVATPDRCSKRQRVEAPSSSTSAALGNGGGLHGFPEEVTSDNHSVFLDLPPPQASTQSIETQGEPPPGGRKWNFNLEESPEVGLTLPTVPADWLILPAVPSEEERAPLPEEVFMAMVRCVEQHRGGGRGAMVG